MQKSRKLCSMGKMRFENEKCGHLKKKIKKSLHLKKSYANIIKLSERHAPLAQLDRASGYGPEGRGFESLRAYQEKP